MPADARRQRKEQGDPHTYSFAGQARSSRFSEPRRCGRRALDVALHFGIDLRF